ncbi:MAG TPA: pirin-like C-terminal cupin domain-containing protein, partial [Methanomassiliicoccales archaeon]|nr:pirin-like C-terminal cupin domain-containing protein [Methanomassiliicoccales archaeon]
ENGVAVKVIAGSLGGAEGPVRDVVTEPELLDISIPENSEFRHDIPSGHAVFAYLIEGEASFDEDFVGAETTVIFGEGDEIIARTGERRARFLLVSGKPIGEPVAWHGPIVMNTQEELEKAFDELNKGTFIKG